MEKIRNKTWRVETKNIQYDDFKEIMREYSEAMLILKAITR
jgi:hypothetical protein